MSEISTHKFVVANDDKGMADHQISCLSDIVRSSIVFDSLAKLLGCMKIIAASDEVEVLRVKNRFRKGYDPTESAGFRNLSSNLRLKESGFVVELQLHLASMIQIQSDDGHKRYVEFRDSQGD